MVLTDPLQIIKGIQDPAIADVMTKLCALFGLTNIVEGQQWAGVLDHGQMALVETAVVGVIVLSPLARRIASVRSQFSCRVNSCPSLLLYSPSMSILAPYRCAGGAAGQPAPQRGGAGRCL